MKTVLLATATLAALLATPVAAQEMAGGQWGFYAGAATDNRSKNASKSDGDPFAFAGAEWESADGAFYFGPAAETIKSGGSNVEAEFAGGWRPQFGGFDFDFNVAHKWRLDSNPGVDDEAWEFTTDIERSIGPASARLQVQYSPDGAGSTEAFTWTEARLGWAFTPRLEGTAAVGYRSQDNAPDYTGWNAGFTYALTDALEAEVRYHSTDIDDLGRQYEDAVVAGISVAF
ncbi:TorF family putative porin [Brevundimonas sp.]|uniref:TorF family putative porin n=1 Tax=Brevundimonas sp. TaxID=1871086 RepID=UPI0035B12788